MSRDLTQDVKDELEKKVLSSILFVEIEVKNEVTRLHNWRGSIEFNGEVFEGVGDFGNVSEIKETNTLEATGINLTLNGIPQDYISLALNDIVQNKPVRIWQGFLDESANVISNPFLIFSGYTDTVDLSEGEETSSLQITAESSMKRLSKKNEKRYTAEDLKIKNPNDKGCDYINQLQGKELTWGR